MKRLVTKAQADHIVGRISGVQPGDTRAEAARKAIALMRSAGMPARTIRKAERMLEEYERREAQTSPAGENR